jgi:hypothetical protein
MSQSSLSTVQIPAEEPDPKDDLIERDSSGNYIVAAPAPAKSYQAMQRELEEETGIPCPFNVKKWFKEVTTDFGRCTEQENHLISLYGKQTGHWDKNGMPCFPCTMCDETLICPAVAAEIKAALASSMKKKVESLESDRWMFEGDGKFMP